MRNKDSVRCRVLAENLSFGRARDESLQSRAEHRGKRGKDAVMCSFRSRLPFSLSPSPRSRSLPSALLGGWVTRRKCLGSASVGLRTRCVAWRWWGRDATETKYKPAYRDTSESRGQQWWLMGPALGEAWTVPIYSTFTGLAAVLQTMLTTAWAQTLCGGSLLVNVTSHCIKLNKGFSGNMGRRKNDGCPVLKLVPRCPNTRGIQLSVTVWAAVEEQFLWMRTVNMKEKGPNMALRTRRPSLRKRQHWLTIPTSVWGVLARNGVSPTVWVLLAQPSVASSPTGCQRMPRKHSVASSGNMLEDSGEAF